MPQYGNGWAFDPTTGAPMPQGYGTQTGPGQVTITGTGPTAPPPAGGSTTGADGMPRKADGSIDMDALMMAHSTSSQNPWNPGATFSNSQPWQNFQFQNPTEDWQRNFNSLSGVDKFRYGFDPQNGGQQAMIAAMTQAGLDPNLIRHIASTFGSSGDENFASALGISGQPMSSNVHQIGNQLWGFDGHGNRYLIKDFGNSGNMGQATQGDWFQNTGDSYLGGGKNAPWDPSNQWFNPMNKPYAPPGTPGAPSGPPGGGGNVSVTPFDPTKVNTTTSPTAPGTVKPYNPDAPGGNQPVTPGTTPAGTGPTPGYTKPKTTMFNPWSKNPFG